MVLFIVVASAIILLAAYFTYGKFLANTVFKLDDKNPVPSVEMEDGVDYVPAKKGMLLGQHFSAIAAAGPINGPILAAVIYGWAPALLWVILGCIFIGGIHDMGSLVAAMMPMWLLLQPRGALGGYFLYIALVVAAIGIMFGGYEINYPAFTNLNPDGSLGEHFWTPMFPILFITIACGACSGFHALVSSGTSSKQLAKETDATAIGYGAMLLEGMVAVVSIVCVMILAKDSELITKAPNFIYAMGIGSFMELIGIPAAFGISFGLMAFTTFVYDTLDVCTRLGRYVIEELTGWRDMKGKVLGTVLTSAVPIFFIFQTMTDAKGNVIPAWKTFWNTFGASNQLLAALALIGISIWLYNTRRNSKVWMAACIPAVLMFLMSNWALLLSIYEGWVLGLGHPAVPVVSVILVILSVLVAVETIYSVSKSKAQIQKEQ